MRNRNTIEFLGTWEQLNNPEFKPLEFEGFRKRGGLNSFVLTPKQWIGETGAIGNEGIVQSERLTRLNRIAIQQMRVLVEDQAIKRLEEN